MARWRLLEPEVDTVSELARVAGVDPLCARVLANRGVSPETARGFLSPSLKSVGAPDEETWRVAARRVVQAIQDGERIGVFGDYDTDGLTSAATLYLALSRYTNNLVVQLPTRQTGYGLLEPYVRDLFAEGVDLIVTADCGISNKAGVELAVSLGMDVIVTDHHIPPEDRPEDLAPRGSSGGRRGRLEVRMGGRQGDRRPGREKAYRQAPGPRLYRDGSGYSTARRG